MLLYALIWMLVINAGTFVTWAHDKAQAIAGGWRVRETDLLGMSALGGWPAALVATRYYRHKTRKQPFATLLWLIATMECGAAIGLFVPVG